MENSKKLILTLILLIFVSCNKNNLRICQECITTNDSLIFQDKKTDELYIRLKAIDHHPSMEKELKANNNYAFYNYVNIFPIGKNVKVKEIINQKSFRKINDNYFEDNELIYFTPSDPKGDYFNILDRKEFVKFSKNKDTVYSRYGIFYKGALIGSKDNK
ncbi:hypothetical protein [Chryseobacterium sp. GP-SGM7]|uniref:hypothetical protein n=1 Tax=Chryseobacterium sp. GP-SGM7 TaxID=3411323 RepID=UPI003B965464